MTIEITSTYVRAAGNGVTTVFNFPFKVFSDAELVVRDILDATGVPTTRALNTDYTVALSITGEGGAVTFTTAPASLHTIDIRSLVELEQPEDIRNLGRFLPEIHEQEFDRLTRQVQDTRRLLALSPRLPDSELPATDWDTLLSLANRKGKYFGYFNATTGAPETFASIGATTLSQSIIGQFLYPQSAGEITAGVTPTNYYYPYFDIRRYGAVVNNISAAATNSTAIQAASTSAYHSGGGTVFVPEGTWYTTSVVYIWNGVSIRGCDKNTSIIKKTTNAASIYNIAIVPRYSGGAVGNPITVLHFIGFNGVGNWAYAACEDLQVQGDTSNPNTTVVTFGMVFTGCIGCRVNHNFAQFTQIGFWWGTDVITSDIFANNAGNVQRGLYVQFMTSTDYHSNYANKFRYAGHDLSWYYANAFSNAADNVGSPWKVGTTEVSLAYLVSGSRGGMFFGNGCETHNGPVFKFINNIGVRFCNNIGLDITSNYTGGSDICGVERDTNNACEYVNLRVQMTSMTGTGARHFGEKVTNELGDYTQHGNLYVASVGDTTNTSSWTNYSGTLSDVRPLKYSTAPIVPIVEGSAVAGAGTYTTQAGGYQRVTTGVDFWLRVTISAHTGTGNIVIGNLPINNAATHDVPVSLLVSNLTFTGQISAVVRAGSMKIDLFSQATGAGAAGVAMDTAFTAWVAGHYPIA